MKREQVITRVTWIWIFALSAASLQPVRPGPVAGFHREIHGLAFAGTAFLLLVLTRDRRQQIRVSSSRLCLLGLSLEFLQHLIYKNSMEWLDVRDDSVAFLASLILYRLGAACKAAFLAPRSSPPTCDNKNIGPYSV